MLGALRVEVFVGELWSDWCELQTDPFEPGGCGGNQAHGVSEAGDCQIDGEPTSCAKVMLCNNLYVCKCEPDAGCVASPMRHVKLDMKLVGNEAHGTATGLTIPDDQPFNIWLERVPD